jgi:hypothetical protein
MRLTTFRRLSPPGLFDYGAQLVYVDRVVSSFRDALIRSGWWDRSLVMIRPLGLVDVAPAILEFLHTPIPSSFAGRSLLQHNQQPVYSESVHARDAFGWAPLRALRSGAFKYIDAPHPELYDLQHDPQEAHNLVATDPAQARALHAQMSELLARGPAGSANSRATRCRPKPTRYCVRSAICRLARGARRRTSARSQRSAGRTTPL